MLRELSLKAFTIGRPLDTTEMSTGYAAIEEPSMSDCHDLKYGHGSFADWLWSVIELVLGARRVQVQTH